MITRIKINGFKSLLHTELYLGPFTCIAGANASGKSNFFDALMFLSKLADETIIKAAQSVRSESQKHADISDLFYRSGNDRLDKMTFEIDILVRPETEDDLGQTAQATITSLRYTLELTLNSDADEHEYPISITQEALQPITLGNMKKGIHFDHKKNWLGSVLHGNRKGTPFISTAEGKVKLHQDGNQGRTTDFIAKKMPRTLLSTVTAESPTAFAARKEMRDWMMLQFEPSALRQPNNVYDVKNAQIAANGLNLPATLYRLDNDKKGSEDVYQQLTNRLKGLVEDVDEISIDRDEKRDLLSLQVTFKSGLKLPAQSLSDGTLRFLGLAIIEADRQNNGLICLEEPENGINPQKIQGMVELLQSMSTDTEAPVDNDNPLRQVIINTHSPIVVGAVPDDSLYVAKEQESYVPQMHRKVKHTAFAALGGTWKVTKTGASVARMGAVLAYLGQIAEPLPSRPNGSLTVAEHAGQYKLDLE